MKNMDILKACFWNSSSALKLKGFAIKDGILIRHCFTRYA